MKSFKLLSKAAIEVLSRYGYVFTGKMSNFNNCDVRIYNKSCSEGCMVSSHLGAEGTLFITFHTQFLNTVPSGLFVMNYSVDATTQSIASDFTSDKRYKCLLRALCEATKQVGG